MFGSRTATAVVVYWVENRVFAFLCHYMAIVMAWIASTCYTETGKHK